MKRWVMDASFERADISSPALLVFPMFAFSLNAPNVNLMTNKEAHQQLRGNTVVHHMISDIH